MINALSKGNYGYTDKGNRYDKSNIGKNVGRVLGATTLSFATAKLLRDPQTKHLLKVYCKDFINDGIQPGVFDTLTNPKLAKLADYLNKSKALRIGWLSLNSAVAVGLAYAMTVGVGKLIGHGFDKIVDYFAMKKADKSAEAQQK